MSNISPIFFTLSAPNSRPSSNRIASSVAAGLSKGTLNLYGWVYEIHTGEIQNFNSQQGRFIDLAGETIPSSFAQPRLQLMAS